MGRIFVTRVFERFARKQRIEDRTLAERIQQADRGLVDAILIGCLIKLRLARRNEGKRGGYRTLVAYKTQTRAFFLYGFSKNERGNVSEVEQVELEAFGALILALTDLVRAWGTHQEWEHYRDQVS